MNLRRLTLAGLTLVFVGGGGYGIYKYFVAPDDKTAYKFAAIERGPITASVSATGTLSPVVSVQVSSQISGQIREILVDYNSAVKAGQLLAQLAPETYEHRVRQVEADLEAARATVAVQQAEQYRAKVNLLDAERDYTRKKTLVDKNFISPAELDKAQTLLEAARAQLRVVEAQGRNSEALVKQRAAQLGQAQVDLGRTEIRAPADGIVIKRSVEPGQTVAASLQAPEMFVIAKNLADMRVETAIDEADVGRLKAGQEATFTVDAFPGKRFKGAVTQVRKSALVVSNVVSYTVIIDAANPDLILLPGMTANVRITTAQKDSVLKIANAALRFRPPSDEKSALAARQPSGGKGSGRPGGGTGKLWTVGANGKPTTIEVKTGINDGNQTELLDSDLAEGREFIVGTASAEKPKVATPRLF